jgi:hypothetical protein
MWRALYMYGHTILKQNFKKSFCNINLKNSQSLSILSSFILTYEFFSKAIFCVLFQAKCLEKSESVNITVYRLQEVVKNLSFSSNC